MPATETPKNRAPQEEGRTFNSWNSSSDLFSSKHVLALSIHFPSLIHEHQEGTTCNKAKYWEWALDAFSGISSRLFAFSCPFAISPNRELKKCSHTLRKSTTTSRKRRKLFIIVFSFAFWRPPTRWPLPIFTSSRFVYISSSWWVSVCFFFLYLFGFFFLYCCWDVVIYPLKIKAKLAKTKTFPRIFHRRQAFFGY